MKLLGLSGSLRAQSFNTALLKAAIAAAPQGVSIERASIEGIPLYNADDEAARGAPDAVRALQIRIIEADGVILVTPEYNSGIPGVFKNAIDWVSRPADGLPRALDAKPVALMSASPGGFGGILSQSAWLPVLRTLGASCWFGGRFLLPNAGKAFDETGALRNEALRAQLAQFVSGFSAFVASRQR